MRTTIFTGILSIFILAQAGEAMAWTGHADVMGVSTSNRWLLTTDIETNCSNTYWASNDAVGIPDIDNAAIDHTYARIKWTPNPYPIQNQQWYITSHGDPPQRWESCDGTWCNLRGVNGDTYYYGTIDLDTAGAMNINSCVDKAFLMVEYNVYRGRYTEYFISSSIHHFG